MRHDFRGIYPMIYAFFDSSGRLDREAMRRQTEAYVRSGVHGVAILGIVTEYNKLDVNERRQVIEWTAEDLAGRLPLTVTVGAHRDRKSVEQGKSGEELGDTGCRWIINKKKKKERQ